MFDNKIIKLEGNVMNMSGINASQMLNPFPVYQPRSSINWVQGVEGAKAFSLMPNSSAVLMDSEKDRFFIKSADQVGMCTLKSYLFTEEQPEPKADYVTRDELVELIKALEVKNEQTDAAVISSTNKKQSKVSADC